MKQAPDGSYLITVVESVAEADKEPGVYAPDGSIYVTIVGTE